MTVERSPRLPNGSTRPREERRSHESDMGSPVEIGGSGVWPWVAILGVLGGLTLGILKFRSRSSRLR
jgi:hypothetical protein